MPRLNILQRFITGLVLVRLSKSNCFVELSENLIESLVDAEDKTNALAGVRTLTADQRSQLIDLLCDILRVGREEEKSETFRIDDDIEREDRYYAETEDEETT